MIFRFKPKIAEEEAALRAIVASSLDCQHCYWMCLLSTRDFKTLWTLSRSGLWNAVSLAISLWDNTPQRRGKCTSVAYTIRQHLSFAMIKVSSSKRQILLCLAKTRNLARPGNESNGILLSFSLVEMGKSLSASLLKQTPKPSKSLFKL